MRQKHATPPGGFANQHGARLMRWCLCDFLDSSQYPAERIYYNAIIH
jgi:hypothetical protein